MRPESMAFSSEPDRALGAALRAVLDRPEEARFVAEVLDRAAAAGVGSPQAVLSRWTRVAVAGAVVAALTSGLLAGTTPEVTSAVDVAWVTATTGSPAAAVLLTAQRAPDATILFASIASN